ncbi:MAG: radical SAM protein [Lentisphaeria bacterium]|nr:radical SAM protein [Lentisphaeria bacterium]
MFLNFSENDDPRHFFTLPFEDGLQISCLPFEKRCFLHQSGRLPKINAGTPPVPESLYSRLQKLSILPNNRCNFHCSYCYAAASKDNNELDKKQLFQAISTFFSLPERNDASVSFLGGGEPLLSQDTVLPAIDFIRKIAPDIPVNIVTNGSVLNKNLKDFLLRQNVSVTVSFEVLPDIQEIQRGSHALVSRNIKELLASGIKVKIRTILTDKNIHRIREMASTVQKEYAGITRWLIEPVSAWSYFESAETAMDFWNAYTEALEELSALPEMKNISWNSLFKRFFSGCSGIYCDGEFVVMPSGEIGLCHRISSPASPLWQRWLWGEFDGRKYQLFPHRAESFYKVPERMAKRCSRCPAFACCGGNCRILAEEAEEEYIDSYCSFIRKCFFEYLRKSCREVLKHRSLPVSGYLEVKI